MAILVKHAFTSGKADGPDPTLVQPSNWNAGHALTQASGFFLGRVSAGPGATEEVSPASAQTLLGLGSAAYVTASSLATNTQIAAGADTAFADADYLTAVKSADGSLIKRSWLNTKNAIVTAWGALIAATTAKAPLALADKLLIADSAASNASKSATLQSILDLINANSALPAGYLNGLTLSNNGGLPASALDIAAGIAVDSSGLQTMKLAAPLTSKRLSANWAVGINAGMLDTGAAADGTYHIYLIKRLDTGVVDVIASLSASAPTLPANYTVYRRIGSITRGNATAGNIDLFIQVGDEFELKTSSTDVNTNNPGAAAVSATLSVPTGIVVTAWLAATFNNTSNTPASLWLSALDTTDEAPNASGKAIISDPSTLGQARSAGWGYVRTDASARIRYRVSFSNGGVTVYLTTRGWTDTRGRV